MSDETNEDVTAEDDVTAEGDVTAALPGELHRDHLVRAGHVLGLLVLLAVVIPFVLYAVPQLIGAEYSYVVVSGSMSPVLMPYDVTFVDGVGPGAIEEGDVINFDRPGEERTTTHRVIDITEQDGQLAFRTAGDNNEGPDPELVPAGQVRGRVMTLGGMVLAIPYVGRIIGFASNQIGFLLLFIVPVTLLIANEIYNVVTGGEPANSEETTQTPDRQDAIEETGLAGPETASEDADADGLTFSPGELKLGTAVLGAFFVYGAWTAISDPGAVTVGVTGSVAVAFLMLGGLYWRGSTETRSVTSQVGVVPSVDGTVIQTAPPVDRSAVQSREALDSLETLVEMSDAIGVPLYRSPNGQTYHLTTETTQYVYGGETGQLRRVNSAASDIGLDGSSGANADQSPEDGRSETAAGTQLVRQSPLDGDFNSEADDD